MDQISAFRPVVQNRYLATPQYKCLIPLNDSPKSDTHIQFSGILTDLFEGKNARQERLAAREQTKATFSRFRSPQEKAAHRATSSATKWRDYKKGTISTSFTQRLLNAIASPPANAIDGRRQRRQHNRTPVAGTSTTWGDIHRGDVNIAAGRPVNAKQESFWQGGRWYVESPNGTRRYL